MSDQIVKWIPKNTRGEFIRVAFADWQGTTLLHVGTFFTDEAGKRCPTPRGFGIAPQRLDELIDALQEARRLAILHGLMRDRERDRARDIAREQEEGRYRVG